MAPLTPTHQLPLTLEETHDSTFLESTFEVREGKIGYPSRICMRLLNTCLDIILDKCRNADVPV